MDRAWGRHAGDEAKMGKAFDLRSEWKAMRAHYDAFLAKFTLVTNGVRDSASGPSNVREDQLDMSCRAVHAHTWLISMDCRVGTTSVCLE